MPYTAYVSAPFNGENWGLSTYCYCCSGGAHAVVDQCCNPMDLGRSSSTTIKFHGDIYIKSIKTTYEGFGVCNNTSIQEPWDALVRVKMYSALNGTGTLIGTVVYAHVASPIANGTYNNPYGRVLGSIAANTCGCTCYEGFHVHMETDGGGSDAFGGHCGMTVTTNTKLFRWTFS